MTGNISKIKRLPARVAPYFRIRHLRGHGVHSPFAYGIIRNALLRGKGRSGKTGQLFTCLKVIGVGTRTAMQLQNLHNYCDYGKTVVHSGNMVQQFGEGEKVLHIFTAGCAAGTVGKTVEELKNGVGAAVILSARNSKPKLNLCKGLAASSECVSIDNRGFMLFFYGSGHQPKHYKL